MGILFQSSVFGPIHSRRLGTSLGINLMPQNKKWCNFNCVYCECGWNPTPSDAVALPTFEQFSNDLESKLTQLRQEGVTPDVITFSGNGEPTLHPSFLPIMRKTVALRDAFFPSAKICVLSNSTRVHLESVYEALMLCDRRIMKIDSPNIQGIHAINQPNFNYSLERVVEGLLQFHGDFVLQTLFFRGEVNGVKIDNTTDNQVADWVELVRRLKPKEVMLYTLDRETPAKNLEKCSVERMQEIAELLHPMGILTSIAG